MARDTGGERVCPSCGAPNWPGAPRCASCGTPFSYETDRSDRDTVIDVSSGEPRVVLPDRGIPEAEWTRNAPPGWQDSIPDPRNKVFVSWGWRGCFLSLIAVTILFCCVCWILGNSFSAFGTANWV